MPHGKRERSPCLLAGLVRVLAEPLLVESSAPQRSVRLARHGRRRWRMSPDVAPQAREKVRGPSVNKVGVRSARCSPRGGLRHWASGVRLHPCTVTSQQASSGTLAIPPFIRPSKDVVPASHPRYHACSMKILPLKGAFAFRKVRLAGRPLWPIPGVSYVPRSCSRSSASGTPSCWSRTCAA